MPNIEYIDGISLVRSFHSFRYNRTAYRPVDADTSVNAIRRMFEIIDDVAAEHSNEYCGVCDAYYDENCNEIDEDEYWEDNDDL